MTNNDITNESKELLINTFEEVKSVVKKHQHRSRAGLMLGFQELGASLKGFIGAYYPVASNIIVINKTPLRRITQTKPSLFKPYGFHVLLHEYIHSLGFLDEQITRHLTYEISKKQFGENHVITELAINMEKYFPNLVYPIYGWVPSKQIPPIEIIRGFDKSSTHHYIT
jgi:hypothetical protein